jgi:SAM-dependent methyltransferase
MPKKITPMPEAIENGILIPTLDRQGWIWLYEDEITKAYIDYSEQTKGTMLEIGAGYGHIVLKVLDKGARVIANDISDDQLDIIKNRVPRDQQPRLKILEGRFPEETDIPEESIDGVLVSRVFHFFEGVKIRKSLDNVNRWLRKGGKIFIVADSVYRTIFKELIPTYEKRVTEGVEWPGLIGDIRKFIPRDKLNPKTQPKMMNFLDPNILRRELSYAGFKVEISSFLKYPCDPEFARLDGREISAAIGVKEY